MFLDVSCAYASSRAFSSCMHIVSHIGMLSETLLMYIVLS